MKCVKVQSDYSPNTYMRLVQTDDGDIVFKICGDGEMRIATSGGRFHGKKLVAVCGAISDLMDALEMPEDEISKEDYSPCKGCFYRGGCGWMLFGTPGMTEEEIFEEHCCGCPCGDGCECNRESGCGNYSEEGD